MLPATAIFTYRWSLPTQASLHGRALDTHLLLNLNIALALIVLAHILLLAGLLFTKRALRPIHQLTLEYLPLAALTALFLFLAAQAQRLWANQRYTGASPTALQVEVTGMQFAWYFRYPGPDGTFGRTRLQLVAPGEGNPLGIDPSDPHSTDDITSSQLVLPVNREVDLTLRALDVIHGFSVPELRLKQNAIPGQTGHIHFTASMPGTYAILCTQLCGLGHYRMQATLRVVPEAEYEAWLAAHEARP
jgi:cytochrome c oxidase subunit 2